jgi:cytidylate kinase
MSTHAYLDNGMAILKARLSGPVSGAVATNVPIRPFITLSREVCAGASTLGRMLLDRLDTEFAEEGQNWLLLDKDLLTRALAHHELPDKLARYLPEDKVSEVDAFMGEIVGLHPSIWALEQKVAEAIIQFAHVGRIIFVGRAAHLLTRSMPGGLHVRLVAPEEIRVRRFMGEHGCAEDAARSSVRSADEARSRFVRSHFNQDINDPHTYDLVINTEHVSANTAAQMIIQALHQRVREAVALQELAGFGVSP